MSRASAAIVKAAGAVVGKTSGTVSSKDVHSKSNGSAPPAPVTLPAPEKVKEPAPTPVEPTPPLDDSVVCLDDVVPDTSVDAQDPASCDVHPLMVLYLPLLCQNVVTINRLRSRNMMFPGAVASSELQQAAAEKVKRDIGTFVIFGFLIEAVAFGASYLNIEGFLV
nr:Hypothetical protein CBG15189 [Haemonchus contortus]